MNTYLPGASVRFFGPMTLLGVPYTPNAAISVTMHGPLGNLGPGQSRTTQSLSFVVDAIGLLHADTTIPLAASPGKWVTRWLAVGADPADTSVGEDYFEVQALAF